MIASAKARLTTEQEERFCIAYALIGSPTYHNATKSAIAAGYAATSASVRGCKLMKRDSVHSRIAQLEKPQLAAWQARNDISVAQVRGKLAALADAAEANGDLTNAIRGVEGVGRTVDAFGDGRNLTIEGDVTINVGQQAALDRLADLLLAGGHATAELLAQARGTPNIGANQPQLSTGEAISAVSGVVCDSEGTQQNNDYRTLGEAEGAGESEVMAEHRPNIGQEDPQAPPTAPALDSDNALSQLSSFESGH